MYWSSWSDTQPAIERASMDGSMRKTLVRFSSAWWQLPPRPNGLALDPENRRLYWVDTRNSEIQYTDLQQGDGVKVTLNVGSVYLFQPYGLTLKENTLYWSTSRYIYSADKMTGGNVRRLVGRFSRPRDVHVYHNYTGIPGMFIHQFYIHFKCSLAIYSFTLGICHSLVLVEFRKKSAMIHCI